jgi:response regulator of citrate/malate metabolism
MSRGLDVIIVEDDPEVCKVISEMVKKFYTWGNVIAFTDYDAATAHCMGGGVSVAIFVLDVFLGQSTCFNFLDRIEARFPMAREDTIMITGNASDDVVNMCLASDISHLLEKPIRAYALQLAVRSIVSKYIRFAKKLLQDPRFAESVSKF